MIFATADDHLVNVDAMNGEFVDRLLYLQRTAKNLDARDFSAYHFLGVIQNGYYVFRFNIIGFQPFDEGRGEIVRRNDNDIFGVGRTTISSLLLMFEQMSHGADGDKR